MSMVTASSLIEAGLALLSLEAEAESAVFLTNSGIKSRTNNCLNGWNIHQFPRLRTLKASNLEPCRNFGHFLATCSFFS
jgi:hypothetical protein